MPRYAFRFEQRLIERREVTESRDVVIEADDLEQAEEAVRHLEDDDMSPIEELEFEEEYGDILGSDFMESSFGELRETDRPADLKASDILLD